MISAVVQECVGRHKGPGDWQYALNGRGGATPRSFGALLAATERGEVVTLESGRAHSWPVVRLPRRRPARVHE